MISIIFPVYNVSKYIEASLLSCLEQTYRDLEIIAINDGSTDESLNILQDYASRDHRIKIITQRNQGVAKARMVGLENSLGDFVCFVDSDDIIPKESISLLYEKIRVNDVDIVIGNYCECFENDYKRTYELPRNGVIGNGEYVDLILSEKVQWGVCGKLYKRELFDNAKLVSFKLGEDAALLMQAIANASKIEFTNQCVYHYLQRIDSAVHLKSANYLSDIYRFRVWVADFLSTCNEVCYKKELVDIFLVRGYVKCIFFGGRRYLSSQDYTDVQKRYLFAEKQLYSWERIIYVTSSFSFVNRLVVLIFQAIRKLKFLYLRNKNDL